MNAACLDRLIQHPVINNDPVLISLLQTADRLAGSVLIVPDFLHMAMEYVGEGMEELTGYSCRDWMIGGIPLLVARAAESDRNSLASVQAMHIRQAKMTGFNRRTIDLQEYQWTLLHRDGREVSVSGSGVILNYSAEMDFRLGVGFIVPDTKRTRALIERCRSLLVQIKVRHNVVYSHDESSISISPEASNHVNGM